MTNQGDTEMSGKEQSLEATESPVSEPRFEMFPSFDNDEAMGAWFAAQDVDATSLETANDVTFSPDVRVLVALPAPHRNAASTVAGTRNLTATQAAPQPPKNSPASRKGEQ